MLSNNRSITRRFVVCIMIGVLTVIGLSVGYGYYSMHRVLKEELGAKAHYMALETAGRIEMEQKSIEAATDTLTLVLAQHPVASEQAYHLLQEHIWANDRIFGAAIAYKPYSKDGRQIAVSPYVYREGNGLVNIDLGQSEYQYDRWAWYSIPERMHKSVWSEPYYAGGDKKPLMVTYSSPIMGGQDYAIFNGVVTGDISLEWLSGLLASLPLDHWGYAFIISPQGVIIAQTPSFPFTNENIFNIAAVQKSRRLEQLMQNMVKGQSGFEPAISLINEEQGRIAYLPVSKSGWSLGIFFSDQALVAKSIRQSKMQLVIGGIGLLALLFITVWLTRSITHPLKQLNTAMQNLSIEDQYAEIPNIHGNDELTELAQSYASMVNGWKTNVKLMKASTAQKKIDSEFRFAHAIRMSLTPKGVPPFPKRRDFDVYALLKPAPNAVSDFYDYFLLEDHQLCILVGDVSGQGMMAALVMTHVHTYIKSITKDVRQPALILKGLANELADWKEGCAFTSLFCAVIDLSNGLCRSAHSGHHGPLVVSMSGKTTDYSDGQEVLAATGSTMPVVEMELQLRVGDTLFFCTDGVLKAENSQSEFYGQERVRAIAAFLRGGNCRQMLERIVENIKEFVSNAEQSDDMTMLAFRYKGTRE